MNEVSCIALVLVRDDWLHLFTSSSVSNVRLSMFSSRVSVLIDNQ